MADLMSGVTIEGIYRDRLIGPDGRTVSDSGWRSNMVVLAGRVLIAAFVKNEAGALGVRTLQVGRGDSSWDTQPPPPPDPGAVTKLLDAAPFVVQQANLTFQYLNAADAVVEKLFPFSL